MGTGTLDVTPCSVVDSITFQSPRIHLQRNRCYPEDGGSWSEDHDLSTRIFLYYLQDHPNADTLAD
jgi:hypothetical protein